MYKTVIPMLLCTMMGASVAAGAAEQMKPGLWEMSIKSDAFRNIPKMSAQQIEQMRKMGVAIPQMQDGAMVSQVCITREMAAMNQPPVEQNTSGCQPKNYQRSGDTYSVDIICDGPDLKGTGKSKGTFSGSTSFTSVYDFKGTAHGQPISSHHESSGKWIAADCGNVKPIPATQPAK